ncbi:MAG: hypothetical protein KUG53_01370 [Pseudomonadales bacterium]|nr:hypothetical protein [Pseudomonadales bacterium]
MDELDEWQLCEELNIAQAALLIVGEDPSTAEYIESCAMHDRPKGYEAMKMAIYGGLRNYNHCQVRYNELKREEGHFNGRYASEREMKEDSYECLSSLLERSIAGTLISRSPSDMNDDDNGCIADMIDVYKSTMNVDSLKRWLRFKRSTTGFFFPEKAEATDFLDPLHPRYAPKLAAAVKAWLAVTSAEKTSPKQALDRWLREHAAEFGLTNGDGVPTTTAMTECSTVANWDYKGGASKTLS